MMQAKYYLRYLCYPNTFILCVRVHEICKNGNCFSKGFIKLAYSRNQQYNSWNETPNNFRILSFQAPLKQNLVTRTTKPIASKLITNQEILGLFIPWSQTPVTLAVIFAISRLVVASTFMMLWGQNDISVWARNTNVKNK